MTNLIKSLTEITGTLDNFLYGNILFWILLAAGLFFTVQTRFVQIRMFPEGISVLTEKSHEGGISSFQALMIATASRVGTGNIAGVATAIVTGGPGAVFWMWVTAVIGSASAFVESTLAQIYKKKDGQSFKGGPAYYIEQALGKRRLGMCFAGILVLTFAVGFNCLQAYNIASSLERYAGENTRLYAVITGLIVAFVCGAVFFGGPDKISAVSSVLVPIMAAVYIIIGISITVYNRAYIPGIFRTIFREAFDFKAIAGGVAGSCMVTGIKRGLFSNEAGMGSAPNAAAAADVSHPVKQGLVQVISVFIDTGIICTTTVFIVLCTGHMTKDKGLDAIPLVQASVKTLFGEAGVAVLTVAVILFAFTSLVGNYFYAEANIKFITESPRVLKIFRGISVILIFAGANSSLQLAWNIADLTMAFMAFINIGAICLLSRTAQKALENYTDQKRLGKNPVFYAEDIGISNTECWKK